MNATTDYRYELMTCAKCGHRHQIIDWNSAAHQATCGVNPPVRMGIDNSEVEKVVSRQPLNCPPVRFPLGSVSLYPNGAKFEVEMPAVIAVSLTIDRLGIPNRIA